jgi:hypothetical protein
MLFRNLQQLFLKKYKILERRISVFRVVIVHVDGMRLCLWTAANSGTFFHPQMIYENGDPRWNDIDRRRRRPWKNLTQCHFVHEKSYIGWAGREPGSPSTYPLRLLFSLANSGIAWWWAQIMKLLTIIYIPFHFIYLRSKYFPQHPYLKQQIYIFS